MLGFLINIVLVLVKVFEIVIFVKQCMIMGGVGKGRGNIIFVLEFNIWVDLEVVKMVFDLGMKMKMVGWDIFCNYVCIDLVFCDEIKVIGMFLVEFCMDI